jgi:hypothetical protein
MSTTLGPPIPIDGPLPVAPPFCLVSAATIVPSDLRFGVGGAVWPYPPGLPTTWAPCSTGTFRTKATGTGWDLPIFESFTNYLPITCSSITAHAPGFTDRVMAAFAATESFAVARELSRGHANPLNPFLCDANCSILAAGAAVTPDVGLAYLEDAIGATGRQGMIHLTPAVATAMNGSYGGFGLEIRSAGGKLTTTSNGTTVAVDGGYIGANPSLHAAAATGQAWAFATGPVQIRRSPDVNLIPTEIAQAMDRSDNTVEYRAERDYLVTWDTELQAAVLIDWTP